MAYPVTGAPSTSTGTTFDCEGPGNGPGNPRTSLRPATVPGVVTPVGQLMNIVVDCPDADISARFWAAVLGWERVQEDAGWVDIADASDGRRRLVFQQIADYRPPGWPDQGPPQQLHLDVRVDDLEIADQRVRALGAVPLGERVVLRTKPTGSTPTRPDTRSVLCSSKPPELRSLHPRETSTPYPVTDAPSTSTGTTPTIVKSPFSCRLPPCLEGFDFRRTEQCSFSSMRRMHDREGFPLPTGMQRALRPGAHRRQAPAVTLSP